MNQKLPWVFSGFFLGVLIGSFLVFGWVLPVFILLLAVFCACLWLIFSREQIYFLSAVFLLAMSVGVARLEWSGTDRNITPSGDQAIVIDEPTAGENSVRYVTQIGETKVLIVTGSDTHFKYGDVLKYFGKIKPVSDTYLNKDDIYYEMVFPKLALINKGEGNWLQARLFVVKNWFNANIARLVPEPESSLAGGLVLGAKESLGKDLLNKFRVAGLVHIVVLSGYNITIVALSIMWLFSKFLSKRTSVVAGIVSIILFAIMVGAGATVIRASVMAILGLLAQVSGRTSEVARALVIAALLMVAINPKLLVFDIGFQLSFLATLGLIYLEPIFKPHFSWLPNRVLWFPIRDIASATLGAQLAVFPLILYTFGNFSVYAFPLNMLVLPLVPTVMLLVFLVGVLVPIPFLSLLAYPIAWVTYALLAYMIALVRLVAHLPFASLQFDNVPIFLIMIIYAGLIYLVLKFNKKEQHLGVGSPSGQNP
ncbi:MAG TPA: ComEC/Rec2 family competence protein [Candidatus Paceibacterota bacterium]